MDYTAIDRITFCGESEGEYHTLFEIDVDEEIQRSGITSSIIMRTYNSGNKRFYIPADYEPQFNPDGKYIIASEGNEIVCNGEISIISSGTVKDMEVKRFKVKE